MPYFCMAEDRARAERHRARACAARSVLVLGVAYKTDIDDMRESPAAEADRAAARRRRRRRLPRPARGRAAAVRPALGAARRRDAGAADCVVIVTAHSSVDYGRVVERAPLVVDFRNATGAARHAGTAMSTSSDARRPHRRRRPRLLGPEPGAQHRAAARRRARLVLRPDPRRTAPRFAPQFPTTRFTERPRRPARATPTLDGDRRSPRRADAPRRSACSVLEAGKHLLRREAARADRRGRPRARRRSPRARDRRLMVGHLLRFHPAFAHGARSWPRAGELGDVLYLYTQPRQNFGKVRARRERALEPRRRTTSRWRWPSSASARSEVSARGECFLRAGRRGRRLRLPARSRRASIAHLHVSWLDPHKGAS